MQKDNDDLYKRLGVRKNSTIETIKKSYKKAALQWHPDKNQHQKDLASEKFKDISEAYEILSDSEKRNLYDRVGLQGLRDMEQGGGHPGHPGHGPDMFNFARGGPGAFFAATGRGGGSGGPNFSDPRDIFKMFFSNNQGMFANEDMGFFGQPGTGGGGIPGMFSQNPNMNPNQNQNPNQNPNQDKFAPGGSFHNKFGPGGTFQKKFGPGGTFQQKFEKKFPDSFPNGFPNKNPNLNPNMEGGNPYMKTGTHPGMKTGKQDDTSDDDTYENSGAKDITHPAKISLETLYNGGTKKMKISNGGREKIFEIKVEPGYKAGTKVTFGHKDHNLPSVGNVAFVIEEKEHSDFERDGDDLIYKNKFDKSNKKIEIETIDGKLIDVLTEGTKVGKTITISNEGMPIRKKGKLVGKGDMIVLLK